MDQSAYEAINGFASSHDGFEDVLRFFAIDAQYLFVALLAILFLARGKWASRNARHGVIAAGFSVVTALAIAQVISHLWERPRPYMADPGHAHLFVPASMDAPALDRLSVRREDVRRAEQELKQGQRGEN